MTRPLLAAGAASALLLVTSAALGARGFSDPAGDTNAAPDLTSVEVAEPAVGTLSIKVAVANFTSLPEDSWVNLWFDVDSSSESGDDAGDEALVRYLSTGATEVYTWNGRQYIAGSTAGVAASFAAGALTVSVPRTSIHANGAFGLLAVGSRGQSVGDEELLASDFAPNEGRSAVTGPGPVAFPDPAGDNDAAPDVTAVRVSDARSGWITFAISTPNYAALPAETALAMIIDVDNNRRTGDGGAELSVEVVGGEISLERWESRSGWLPDDLPTRARVRQSTNVVSIDIHVSELDNTRAFGFAVAGVDVNTAEQQLVGIDLAPDTGTYWHYALVNKAAVKLVFTRTVTKPAKPKAGRPFTVGASITRSDTGRGVAAGTVGCRVLAAEKKVPAKGRISGGAALCTFVVPTSARGRVLRGTVTVRSGGASLAWDFAFVVL